MEAAGREGGGGGSSGVGRRRASTPVPHRSMWLSTRVLCLGASLVSLLLLIMPYQLYQRLSTSTTAEGGGADESASTVSLMLKRLRGGEEERPRRAVVLCAYSNYTARLAWTQISALQEVHGETGLDYLVYHAGELEESALMVQALRSLPHVRVRDLTPWVLKTYGGNESHVSSFRGYMCKPASLLASTDYDQLSFVDLDIILTASPFNLTTTRTFKETGVYLFRDQRAHLASVMDCSMDPHSLESYRQMLKGLWWELRPEYANTTVLPKGLAQSPPFTNYSFEVGESAVVVWDRRRTRAAMEVLEWLLRPQTLPRLQEHMVGDKELYWVSLALSETSFRLNPYAWVGMGFWATSKDGEDFVAPHRNTLAQWAPLHGEGSTVPWLLYANGDGVEHYMANREYFPQDFVVGAPVRYESVTCHPALRSLHPLPLPPYLVRVWAEYQATWERAGLAVAAMTPSRP